MPARRGDKWEGRLKIAGQVVSTRRFETKRAAADWERRQRGAFDEHGYDPSRGKVAVEVLLVAWLEERAGRVSRTTLNTDRYLLPTSGQRSGRTGTETILPTWLRKLHVGKVTGAAISAWQDGLLARGLAPTSVKRHRESLGRTLHDLRHTAACEWILRGVPLTTVQAWLGHSSVEITARYLHHLGDSADRSALQLLNDSAAHTLTPGVISG